MALASHNLNLTVGNGNEVDGNGNDGNDGNGNGDDGNGNGNDGNGNDGNGNGNDGNDNGNGNNNNNIINNNKNKNEHNNNITNNNIMKKKKKKKATTTTATPSSLNMWLIKNNGYAEEDLLIWNAVATLGMVMKKYVKKLDDAVMYDYVDHCHPIVVNVRHGGHWVLVTGYDKKKNGTFYVNDPGYRVESYEKKEMLKFVVYEYARAARDEEMMIHQEEAALLVGDTTMTTIT